MFFRDQDLTLEGRHEFTRHFAIVSLLSAAWNKCDRNPKQEWLLQQDRDPNQVDLRHVTILGRGG